MMQIQAKGVKKSFFSGGKVISVLDGINLVLTSGKKIAIVGPSGVGKTCFLQILAGLDEPTEGTVFWDGKDFLSMTESQRCLWRRKNLGFVFQFYHLMPELSVVENVMLPLMFLGYTTSYAKKEAKRLLERFGLADKIYQRVFVLSGGEMQRIAIIRAVIHRPSFVFADEPTGNLDENMKGEVWSFLFDMVKEYSIGLLAVTHNLESLSEFDEIYLLKAGRLFPYVGSVNY